MTEWNETITLINEAVSLITRERAPERNEEQIGDTPHVLEEMPGSLEGTVEVVRLVTHEPVQQQTRRASGGCAQVQQQERIAAQRVVFPMPPVMEEIVGVLRERIMAQKMDIPAPRVIVEIVVPMS